MIKKLINAGALRQFTHNDGSGFVMAYDKHITDLVLAQSMPSESDLLKLARQHARGREEDRGINDLLFTRRRFLNMMNVALAGQLAQFADVDGLVEFLDGLHLIGTENEKWAPAQLAITAVQHYIKENER